MKVVEPRINQLHQFAVLVIGLVELLEACKREFVVKIFPVPFDHDLFHVVTFGISCQIGVIRNAYWWGRGFFIHRKICLSANSSVKRDMRYTPRSSGGLTRCKAQPGAIGFQNWLAGAPTKSKTSFLKRER